MLNKYLFGLNILFFKGCILTPTDYSLLGSDEKKFYTKEYKLNKSCIKKITLTRQIIYNYIALNIIYTKDNSLITFDQWQW